MNVKWTIFYANYDWMTLILGTQWKQVKWKMNPALLSILEKGEGETERSKIRFLAGHHTSWYTKYCENYHPFYSIT